MLLLFPNPFRACPCTRPCQKVLWPCQSTESCSTLHKFHTAHHLIRNAQNLNLRMHHNFKAEDFVGQISVVGHSVSFGNAATRVCQKLTQKYLILLHLQLTRPGFGTLAEDDADPWTHWQNGDPCTTSCQKRLALSFTPHFQRKVEHLRWPKVMQNSSWNLLLFLFILARETGMFFVDFSGGVLIDFHGFQINNLQLTKTRCKSTGFRILIRIYIRCSGIVICSWRS